MLGYAKALVGGLVAALTSLQVALPDGVTSAEWISVALAGLVGLGVVAAVPNRAPAPAADLGDGPQDDGA